MHLMIFIALLWIGLVSQRPDTTLHHHSSPCVFVTMTTMNNDELTRMQVDRPDDHDNIDEGLYSRQLYVLGKEAMKQMAQSNVLIVGLGGLGVEIAKNVTLAGVKSISLYDPQPVTVEDLSSQYFLTESDIGKSRAECSGPRLAELNQYVPITVVSGPNRQLDEQMLAQYQTVVLTDCDLETQVRVNAFTHSKGIKFISADTRGLFGQLFCDFGDKFTVVDPTGEEPLSGIISSIELDGTVAALDETRHGLEDGDWVKFSEVQGMDQLNDGEPREIKVTGPYTFRLTEGDLSKYGTYRKGGLFTQVKKPKHLSFQTLEQQLANPEYLISDFAKFGRPPQLHIAFLTAQAFKLKNGGSLPRPYNKEDAAQFVHLAKSVASQYPTILGEETKLDEGLLKQFAYQSRGDLAPMASVFGGMAAQEVLKACSGKFMPAQQFFYFDSLESLPSYEVTEDDAKPQGTRYDGTIAVFGLKFVQKLANLRVFLVGSGAIGCEMLKNWALLGLGSGSKGHIFVTDNDNIEKSNLNRQFLFRPKDVGKMKSSVAATAVAHMNPDMQGHIEAKGDKVGPETEDIFNDEFWLSLDLVTNALDNVEARTYIDTRCVFFKKPLLESGTLGTKGNVQVVVPNMTESYQSSRDPPEKSIPLCTLRSFPNKIDHTIAWAKSLFQGYFADAPENVNQYLSQPNFVESTLKQAPDQKGVLETIKSYLVTERPLKFEQCVEWARMEFERKYNYEIRQLLYNFPPDARTSTGAHFWSGPKRAPSPLKFDTSNPNHLNFVIAAANLRAFNFGLNGQDFSSDAIAELANEVDVPEFQPQQNLTIAVTDEEQNAMSSSTDGIQEIVDSLPPPSSLAGFRLAKVEFEKDDDTNHHIDFITAASNLRALNYEIEPSDRSKTKFIAGRIIPAIATTTSLVTGLVCLELPKVVDGQKKIDDYKNGFINLALPFFGFSEPIASSKMKYNDKEMDSIWGRFELHDPTMTLQQLIEYFKEKEGLEVTMLSCGATLLYACFRPNKERMAMTLPTLVETVSRQPLSANKRTLVFDVCVDDEEGEDVEVPFVTLYL